jgi:predicted metalloprotease with PDZ domain
MQIQSLTIDDELAYSNLLSLAAHEMFHTWNVKRLRPAALCLPDLAKENYTDLLWFCEGTTSYYDNLIVARAGLNTAEAYLASLAESIYQARARPGSRVQSVAESSFDAWVKFNLATANDMNSTVSFYESGALVSFLLDLELRHRSDNRLSLDTLLREMYTRFPVSGPGFTTENLIETLNELSNTRFEEFFSDFVYGTKQYPFEDLVGVIGLEMVPQDNEPKAYMGLALGEQNGKPVVRIVLSDGPAYLAGVNPGDELIAVNGEPFAAADFTRQIERRFKPGDRVQMDIFRRGRERRMEFNLSVKPNSRLRLVPLPTRTRQQQAAYCSWLHISS